MKILITGGAGFIGSNFIHYWLKNHKEDYLLNLDKLTYAGNLENLKEIHSHAHYQFVKGDICDSKIVHEVMKGRDVVVHFADESHVDRSIMTPAIFTQTNVNGTLILLEAALKNKVSRFHHISTDEVFGSLGLEEKSKFSEISPYLPRSPYAASKASSDHFVRACWETYGLPITISNCSNNFGPYQHPEKLIPLAITNLLEGKKVPVYGNGRNVRDWLFVEDHCRAIDQILTSGKTGETYCIGGLTEDISNLEVIKKVIKILGKDEKLIQFVPDRPGHDLKYAINWSKIKNELNWKPQSDFDTWLNITVGWYKKNISWWKRLKNLSFEKYYR